MRYIPKIIHQTWRTNVIPERWVPLVEKLKKCNPNWEYKLWTDAEMFQFVKKEYPDFYPVFERFPKPIMRVDAFRYLLMDFYGGVYLDLDYEVLTPFDFEEWQVVLPLARSTGFGDARNVLGNALFASIPRHPFWMDAIEDLQQQPPTMEQEVYDATGGRFLSRILEQHKYGNELYTPERLVYHPTTPKNKKELAAIKANGISRGVHYTWGSWKDRYTWLHVKRKLHRMVSGVEED